ncbi:restriction endonuclease subunit S [Oceanimonas sp. AH20CE76]|uniref:restriction endonuclease subunit S n=1 Tax=Oceanimonas sp. AH20CE76 TaxID=2977120 RepID=UPI0031FEACBC
MNNQVAQVSEKAMAAAEPMVPAGYKQTEVGVIPEDWEVSAIADKHTIATGSTPPTANPKNYGEDFLFVSPADLSDKKYILTTEKKLSKQGFALSKKYPSGSTLFTCIGSTIGKTGFATEELTSNQQINAVFPSEDSDTEFTYYAITYIAPKVKALAGQQAVPLVNKSEFGETIFGFPRERKEQTAIANALSDVDALIGSLEALIVKKQAIKTATMQQLLTGRTRLPQFANRPDGSPKGYKTSELGEIPEDWEFCTLDDVLDTCTSGGTPYRGNPSFYKGAVRWITSGELNYCKINDTYEKISEDAVVKSNLKIHPEGTFLMAITGLEAAGTRGACGIVGAPATTNQSCMALYPNSRLESQYLYHWYVYNGDSLAFKYCQGTKQLSYTAGLVRKISIFLPVSAQEQTAIATILSDMDEEIQALEARLTKTRDLKQGMMQQLLTGKIRLIKPLAGDEHHAG